MKMMKKIMINWVVAMAILVSLTLSVSAVTLSGHVTPAFGTCVSHPNEIVYVYDNSSGFNYMISPNWYTGAWSVTGLPFGHLYTLGADITTSHPCYGQYTLTGNYNVSSDTSGLDFAYYAIKQ